MRKRGSSGRREMVEGKCVNYYYFGTKLLGRSAMPQQNGMMVMMVKVMMLSMRGGEEYWQVELIKKKGSRRPTSHDKKQGNK
jgi:hypothetical protein